tara:strand:- start:2271 stop:3101 length:831 start_codon:yes stop_codon:yes gene_type:complete
MKTVIELLDGKWEYDYFNLIAKHINVQEDLDIVFMKWDQDIPKTKNKCILFVTSDEHHKYHEKFTNHPNVILTFRNYLPEQHHPKVKALPLGYLQGFEHEDINFNDRKYDYSFSGTLPDAPCDATRHALKFSLERLDTLEQQYEKFVLFYEGWAKGLTMPEYADVMYNSRVALCPKGYTSSETFRYFEAARAGCVIISEPKPDVWFYKDAPHIEIKDWLNLPSVLRSILKDKDLLNHHHELTKKWWEEKCSPESVGAYITRELNKLKFRFRYEGYE